MAGGCPDAAQHPGGNYYVNLITGEIQRANGWQSIVLKVNGWTGPYDWCGAKAFAGSHTGSAVLHSPGKIAAAAASAVTGGLSGFLGALGSRNLWLRVLKIIAGMALVITGIVQITHAQNIAKTALKGAVHA
ncbi:MAG TPA: hypothetical protein VH307_31285 [Streptosporangiaceae bacterium]|nr:hypothetical protein [Streptosporangiaceae bacterium]